MNRRVLVVTGSRAEFGLLRSTMEAIDSHPDLDLLVVADARLLQVHAQADRGELVSTWCLALRRVERERRGRRGVLCAWRRRRSPLATPPQCDEHE